MSFFSEVNRLAAKEIVARYPHPKSAILPLAHLAQDQDGWLSVDAMNEIAELTGCSSKAVETRIYRARQILKEQLKDLRS